MDADSYLHWLMTTELSIARPSDLEAAARAVVEAIEAERAEIDEDNSGDDDMLLALRAIRAALAEGSLPVQLLQQFREDFAAQPEGGGPPASQILEQELREIAEGISSDRWSTETYQKLEQALDVYLDGGDEEVMWRTVDEIDGLLERTSAAYAGTDILPKEVTMESMVTHKLLCEGIACWQAAIEMLRDDESEDEPDWIAVLQEAESGNRLLVAVQIYSGRLRSAVAGLKTA